MVWFVAAVVLGRSALLGLSALFVVEAPVAGFLGHAWGLLVAAWLAQGLIGGDRGTRGLLLLSMTLGLGIAAVQIYWLPVGEAGWLVWSMAGLQVVLILLLGWGPGVQGFLDDAELKRGERALDAAHAVGGGTDEEELGALVAG